MPIDSLDVNGSPRIAGEDVDHVAVLASVGTELPPIIVRRATRWVIDGRHRLRAAELRDEATIPVRFFDGDQRSAFVLAVRMNIDGGLPLSLADRKAAAARVVSWYACWSDRLIASMTGLSPHTVSEVRQRANGEHRANVRIGRDGRIRPMDIESRKLVAREALMDDPNLSLRQVAKKARISPETARVIRADLFRKDVSAPLPVDVPQQAVVGQHVGIGNLCADPSLRLTEAGRMLLRLFNAHVASRGNWSAIANTVPEHCRPAVAQIAVDCAVFWQSLANRLSREVGGSM
ncbi:ParB N-terminal domain-containing protein [Actinophytocola sp.]|uniref:ParB N-terminal domain-containing protein n=1 Tax=Actinophytocola sp. TaxID=1872138 RepID=UPI002ED68E3B